MAKSLGTLGFFTHGFDDMLALWNALGYPTGRVEDLEFGMPDLDVAMAGAFKSALARVRQAGIRIRGIDIADTLARLSDAANTMMFYEGARFHEARYHEHGGRLEALAQLVRDGLQIPRERYEQTRRFVDSCKVQIRKMFATTPVILTPAAVGPAPLGLAYTGDTRMKAPWTALGTPAISIPMAIPNGLP